MSNVIIKVYGNVIDLANVMQTGSYISLHQLPKNLKNQSISDFNDFLHKNIKYVADDGKQFVKTYKNVMQEKTADCKTFSSLGKAFFLQKNINTHFLFLSRKRILKHVCLISLDKECLVIDLLSKNIFYKLENYLNKFQYTEYLIF